MNTSKIKAYAPRARNDFIQAVTERANLYGIFDDQTTEPCRTQGDVALIGDRAFSRKEGELREKLVSRVKREGFKQVMEACAHTWLNRFVALRYMELHDYLEHGYRALSHPNGSDTPEILENVEKLEFQGLKKDKVIELCLAGDKENELYRLLMVAQCDALHQAMPFLFDKIDSETELLLPANLLHSDSPIRKLVNDIDEESWRDIEIIGWIYQFYISEKKDQVIGKVVKSDDIPAATQLFTPDWIVKYMVHNTLGRMWLATYPESGLRDKMEYYIEPAEQEPGVQAELDRITPKELNPEEITFLDPACGSGHILVEAYDVFKEIYLERGYRKRDIPRLILEKNIFGLDICDRAAQLACFAVLMKAREDDRKILRRDGLRLNVMAIQEGASNDAVYIDHFFPGDEHRDVRNVSKELFELFEDGKTFGSLIEIPEDIAGRMDDVKRAVDDKLSGWVPDSGSQALRKLCDQCWILSKKYDCVVTNPPYMGGKGMNPKLKDFAKGRFPASKSDLFAMFIEKCSHFCKSNGMVALITMQAWMFLSTFESLRKWILDTKTITALAHLGAKSFGTITGEVVQTSAFFFLNCFVDIIFKPCFLRLTNGDGAQKRKDLIRQQSRYDFIKQGDFSHIPKNPIAYWVSPNMIKIFNNCKFLGDICEPREGMTTGNNDKYVRLWYEVVFSRICLTANNRPEAKNVGCKWFPYNKGGEFRKWYGNIEYIVDWSNDGSEIQTTMHPSGKRIWAHNFNLDYIFKQCLTWTDITSKGLSSRYMPPGFIFDATGLSAFFQSGDDLFFSLSLSNSISVAHIAEIINPTLHFKSGDFKRIPLPKSIDKSALKQLVFGAIELAKSDWNFKETSWGFQKLPVLTTKLKKSKLLLSFHNWSKQCINQSEKMQRLETKNNQIFIKAYGLQDEMTPEVPLSEITLTCNPHYRYKGDKTQEELEKLQRTDTIKELISYAVGCMMGRYSLDHPGLIYAHSGGVGFDPAKYQTFPADDDGIIPLLDDEWFDDDATNRFAEFLKVAWTPETLEENLKFVADSLNAKNNESPVGAIRRYLSVSFFKDHLKTYKKRPIYWLFSSGRQKAFQCLVYLHRYNESTLSRMRGLYVTPLQGKFNARIESLQNEKDADSTASVQRKIQKEIELIKKKHEELRKFDDALRHYTDMKISIDLDDGVKVNYGKFGDLLAEKKAVTGKK
jgi:type II restriction/modification system DNA methylase subunit YeeA